MSKQVINIGTAANDKSGDSARVAGAKINDNFTEVYDAITVLQGTLSDFLIKDMTVTCNGTVGQVISYPSVRSNTAPAIIDYEGIGITVTAFDEDGFTITSLSAGNFGYIQ